jgi:hypothetical protein
VQRATDLHETVHVTSVYLSIIKLGSASKTQCPPTEQNDVSSRGKTSKKMVLLVFSKNKIKTCFVENLRNEGKSYIVFVFKHFIALRCILKDVKTQS